MSNTEKKKIRARRCKVVKRNLTIQEVKNILNNQNNTARPNNRDGEENAFKKTLKGSKKYLKHNGLINDEEE